MENAETAIKKAITADTELSKMDISIFPQGSYKSRTNIRQDSDVDICVRLNSTFFPRYPLGKDKSYYGNVDGSVSFYDFKNKVQNALENYFGYGNVNRGNKAFDIKSNSYRVDADVLAAFAYRYYNGDGVDDYIDSTGVAFLTDTGERINNWPHHTYDNGVIKQGNTGERYKKMVRILKNLRNEMQDNQVVASDIPSFLLESLAWNVPDDGFNHDQYKDDVRYVIAHVFNITQTDEKCKNLCEVNDIKLLFGDHQPWTRKQVNDFLDAAWNHIGYK